MKHRLFTAVCWSSSQAACTLLRRPRTGRRLILRLPPHARRNASFTRGWQRPNDHRARRNAHWRDSGKRNFHVFGQTRRLGLLRTSFPITINNKVVVPSVRICAEKLLTPSVQAA